MDKIDLNRLMWLVMGAGSKGVIGGLVRGFVPGAGITPDIATAFIGFFIAQQGGRWLSPFGEGMLIASAGQIVRGTIDQLFQQFQGQGTQGKTTTKLTEGSESLGGLSTEQYLTQKYGVKVG